MIQSKTIFVIGAAGLLGSEISESVIMADANLIIAERDTSRAEELLKKLCDKYPEASSRILITELDITNKKSIINALELGFKKFGSLDGFVNTAYPRPKGFGKNFFDVEYDTFCASLNLHLGGYFLAAQAFSEFAKEKKLSASLVNIASIYGVIAPRFDIYQNTNMTNGPEYAVIKSGIIQLTKFMAKELQGLPLRVNTVSPGGIEDGQPESFQQAYKDHCSQKGMLSPSDVTGAIIFLLSDMAKYITGQNIIVDDGFTL